MHNYAIIDERRRLITGQLNADFFESHDSLLHSFPVGSYGRNTAIMECLDPKMPFALPHEMYHNFNKTSENGQHALLQAVRNSLMKAYPQCVAADDHIAVPFEDGMTFRLTPGFFILKGGGMLYPDAGAGGSWKTLDSEQEVDPFNAFDRECKGNLVRLCRMLRVWKQQWGVPISELLIDTLTWHFLHEWPDRHKSRAHYGKMCRDFFHWLSEQEPEQEYWLAPGQCRRAYRQEPFQPTAKAAFELASQNDKPGWCKIFGEAF